MLQTLYPRFDREEQMSVKGPHLSVNFEMEGTGEAWDVCTPRSCRTIPA